MCVCVCVRERERERERERVCVLYALNLENMYMYRLCKQLEPVQARCSMYSLLLLLLLSSSNCIAMDHYKVL